MRFDFILTNYIKLITNKRCVNETLACSAKCNHLLIAGLLPTIVLRWRTRGIIKEACSAGALVLFATQVNNMKNTFSSHGNNIN